MRNIVLILATIFIAFSSSNSRELAGKNLPETLKLENETLVLNGAGVVTKLLFKVYAIGLYIEKKSNDLNAIMNQDKAYIIRMHFVRSVGREKMIESMNTGFFKSTNGKPETLNKEINQLNSFFTEAELKENDILQFEYKPGTGTKISLNGKMKGNIPGFQFKRALIGIWLGSQPRQESVKQNLLGND